MNLKVFLIIPLLILDVRSDSIQIKNQTHVYCIDEEENSTIFITPPVQTIHDPHIKNDIEWNDEEWIAKNSNELVLAPITDKRWEEFRVIRTRRFDSDLRGSISFSIYSAQSLVFYLLDGKNVDYYVEEQIHSERWTHFTVFLHDNNLYIAKNGGIIYTSYDFKPQTLQVESQEISLWKLHDYDFKSATSPSENPTILKISPTKHSQLILYSLLCPTCRLHINDIIIEGNVTENTTMKSWKQTIFPINEENETEITIIRQSESQSDKIFWGLDARIENSHNTAAYKIRKSESQLNFTCKILNESPEHEKRRRSADNSSICQTPGRLGAKCDIACESILGESYKYCQRHKICESSYCNCAWGFKGKECDESCKEGTWGLNCLNSCQSKCLDSCNPNTGQCEELFIESWSNSFVKKLKILIPLLGVVSGLLIVLSVGRYSYKKYSTTKPNSTTQQLLNDEDVEAAKHLKESSLVENAKLCHNNNNNDLEDVLCTSPGSEVNSDSVSLSFTR